MTTPSPAAGSEGLLKRINAILAMHANYLQNQGGSVKFQMSSEDATIELMQLLAAQNNATYEAVMEAIKDRELYEPVTKRVVKPDDKAMIDLAKDQRGSLVFIQDNGYNQACAELRQSIAKIFGKEGDL